MRIHAAILIACVCGFASFSSGSSKAEDCYDAELVRSWVELNPSIPQGDPFLEKSIFRSGDRIALGIVHGFKREELTEPARLDRVLLIVRLSFSQPEYITRSQDRDPAVTRLLLLVLEQRCTDDGLRGRIYETERYIDSQVSKLDKGKNRR